jgi:hypothetical protein
MNPKDKLHKYDNVNRTLMTKNGITDFAASTCNFITKYYDPKLTSISIVGEFNNTYTIGILK